MWGPLDDVVMGGVSESGFEVVSGAGEDGQSAGIFSGVVSSSNNGGFASVSPACFLLVLYSNHVDSFLITMILLLTMLILLLTTLNQCTRPMFLWVSDGATSGCYVVDCSLCATHIHHAVHLAAARAAQKQLYAEIEHLLHYLIHMFLCQLLCQLLIMSCASQPPCCASCIQS